MGVALLVAVVLNYLMPEQVFVLIASLAAFATVWVWLMILLSHFSMRRGLSAEERSKINSRSLLAGWSAVDAAVYGAGDRRAGNGGRDARGAVSRVGLVGAADGGVVRAGA